ncbi:hypothetical protein HDU78_004794 [Chytriomyces hyalinus]|uniref:RRM domain-containing protein n=1 Tax=Chytriomyces confervae TaxID=246404 RepID=A0A507FK11_9FUNG|nr:hypothetical protein HDU78_004794 [Chytriomyces hyalinus]KAJ3266112.1 hypothetical protein HDU77_002599 [Chytriomyces hyalinus]KAJ3408751.1 hypothetical protein HDU80_004696 [Chytriomyces hyalinus]TPX76739.1 hypothetical protein CcCBS67573_g01961 [Chytriomyces confervae]
MSLVFRRLFRSSTAAFEKKNIFVGNLPWSIKESDLSTLFSQVGKVDAVRIITDRESGRSRGFGFVEMEEADAIAAIEKLNGSELGGRELRANLAEPKEERPPRAEGGFQRQGGFQRGGDRGDRGGFERRGGESRDRY